MPPCHCDPLSVGSGGEGEAFPFESKGGEQGYSAVVRELASYQCGPGSNPSVDAIMCIEFVVGSLPSSKRFFSGHFRFSPSLKTNTSKFQLDLGCTDMYQRVLMNSY